MKPIRKENAMLTSDEKKLKNAMKLLVRDGKSGQYYEAAKERYISLKSDERIRNIASDLDPNGVDFWVKEFSNDCAIIDSMINS